MVGSKEAYDAFVAKFPEFEALADFAFETDGWDRYLHDVFERYWSDPDSFNFEEFSMPALISEMLRICRDFVHALLEVSDAGGSTDSDVAQ